MSEVVEIYTRVMRFTDRAVLTNDGDRIESNVWIPKSVIENLPEYLDLGECYTFEVQARFAEKEGLV